MITDIKMRNDFRGVIGKNSIRPGCDIKPVHVRELQFQLLAQPTEEMMRVTLNIQLNCRLC